MVWWWSEGEGSVQVKWLDSEGDPFARAPAVAGRNYGIPATMKGTPQ